MFVVFTFEQQAVVFLVTIVKTFLNERINCQRKVCATLVANET